MARYTEKRLYSFLHNLRAKEKEFFEGRIPCLSSESKGVLGLYMFYLKNNTKMKDLKIKEFTKFLEQLENSNDSGF